MGTLRKMKPFISAEVLFAAVLSVSVYSKNPDFGARLNPPTGLTAQSGDHKVLLTWRPTTSYAEADYYVYQSTNPSQLLQRIGITTNTSYVVTNLTNGTTYFFCVTAALNGSAESVASNHVAATPR